MTESERRRLKFLLLAAATALEEGRLPLGATFQFDNEITLQERSLLADAMAFGIRYWVADTFAEDSA
jgi:hypothetical protein